MVTTEVRNHLLPKMGEQLLPPRKVSVLITMDNTQYPVDLVLDLRLPPFEGWSLVGFDSGLDVLWNVLYVVVFIKNVSYQWEISLKY